MIDHNWIDDDLITLQIGGLTGNARRVYFQPKDAMLLYSYLSRHNLSCQVGIVFQGCEVLVREDYLEDLKELLEMLSLTVVDKQTHCRILKMSTERRTS